MKPIFLEQNSDNERFLYLQLYDAVKQQILSGEMKSGEKLPSLRALSRDLGLSITTAELAYNQLLVEGYITSRPKSGYYIAEISPLSAVPSGTRKIENMPPASSVSRDSFSIFPEMGGFIFQPSAYITDPSCFDFIKWKKCAARVFNEYSDLLLFESDPQGEAALRFGIAKYLYASRGVTASPERIVVGAGTQQITSHLSRILLKMGIRLVSLEAPGYLPVQSMFRDAGFTISHIPVARDGIEIAKLPTNIPSAVYVNPSNQFPTGAVMPIGRRYEILDWAAENSSIIIEDDYDSELRYFGKPVPALQGLDSRGCVVYLGTEIFRSIKHQYTQTCSKSEQLTLAFFMEDGYYYTGIRKLRSLYSQKLQAVLQSFAAHGKGIITPIDTHSGINLTVKVRSAKKAEQLCEEAKSLGLQMVPLSEITDQETSALIFYYSQIPLAQIDSLIHRLTVLWTSEA